MGMSIKSGGGGRGGRRRGKRHAPMSEINVTPFVDVMLVLLIIFMVAAPMMTGGVPVDLPQAKGTQLESPKKEPMVVSVTREGKVYLGQQETDVITLEDIGAKLQVIAKERGGTDEPIFVRGDRAVEYQHVARVMARIKEAGFRKLSLVTELGQGG